MTQKQKTRRLGHRASKIVCVAADGFEDSKAHTYLQARWIARRAGLTADRARLIAEIAFERGPA